MERQTDIFGQSHYNGRTHAQKARSIQGKQGSLFSKSGLPGQMGLFDDGTTPDDLLNPPARSTTTNTTNEEGSK